MAARGIGQQTHETLKPFVLEETYEVLEALDSGNRQELCEELGDLIMQVMIHAQVAIENGEFDVNDVPGRHIEQADASPPPRLRRRAGQWSAGRAAQLAEY